MVTDLNREISTEGSQTVEKLLNKCSTLWYLVNKFQNDSEISFTPLRMAKMKITDDRLC